MLCCFLGVSVVLVSQERHLFDACAPLVWLLFCYKDARFSPNLWGFFYPLTVRWKLLIMFLYGSCLLLNRTVLCDESKVFWSPYSSLVPIAFVVEIFDEE